MESHNKMLGVYETCVETSARVQLDRMLVIQDEAVIYFFKLKILIRTAVPCVNMELSFLKSNYFNSFS